MHGLTRQRAADSTALGSSANAAHDRSTAIGFGATTTSADQVVLGGAGSSIVVADIAASDAVQVGAEQVVTIDANGTLGVSNVATVASLNNVRVSVDYLAAVTDAQFSTLSGRVDGLSSALANTNFRLDDLDQRLSGGVAAAMAMGNAPIIPGSNVSLWANAATYGGEQGFALSITGRVSEQVYVSAGASGNTGDGDWGGRVGVGIGF